MSPKSELLSPKEGLIATDLDPSKLPDDSTDSISSLPTSPSDSGSIQTGSEYTKLSVYSPTQDSHQFSIPEEIASEPQSENALPDKHFASLNEPEYTSTSEGGYYSSSARGYSYSQSSMSPNALISPSTTYPVAGFNHTFSGAAEGGAMMMYPNAMSPTAYMSPYNTTTGKQYTWPATPNGYGSFSHDLMPSSYASYQTGFSQLPRANYPGTYFPATQMPVTSSPTC